jgi:hypothetical protein
MYNTTGIARKKEAREWDVIVSVAEPHHVYTGSGSSS